MSEVTRVIVEKHVTINSKKRHIAFQDNGPYSPDVQKLEVSMLFAGIFVADILRAVPINKYFELYKPKATDQSEGGFIKVVIEFEDHSIRSRGTSGNSKTKWSQVQTFSYSRLRAREEEEEMLHTCGISLKPLCKDFRRTNPTETYIYEC